MKKEMFLKSLAILRFEFPYVLVFAVFFNIIFELPALVILFGIMGFILQVIIYSRGAELIKTGSINQPNFDKFRIYFGDFLLVTLIMVFPLAVLAMSLSEKEVWVIYGLEGIISLISIYIGPFLFMKGTRLKSIQLGIKFLLNNIFPTLPLLMLTALPWGINLFARPMLLQESGKLKTGFSTLITGYGFSLVTICFTLVVYYTACMVLPKDAPEHEEGH